jgi:hypothetical protein
MKKLCVHAITHHKVKVGDGNFGINFKVIVRCTMPNTRIIETGLEDWGFSMCFCPMDWWVKI